MKVLELTGTPYEIGLNHGREAKSEVNFSLDSYERLFYQNANITWAQAKEFARQHLNAIERANVSLVEEMEGVAKGASVDFEDILALNARSEIVLTQNNMDGCTSFAVMPPVGEKAFLAQTWDWKSAQSRSLVMAKIRQQNKPAINMVTEGGIIGKIGQNNCGLGVCLNALRANVKSNQLPVHLGLREVLNARDIHEAHNKVVNGKLGSSANFMVAQDNGIQHKAINLELSPDKYDKKETETSFLYHTNHFCSGAVKESIGQENINESENSFDRIDRIRELMMPLTSNHEVASESDIKMWLSDHANKPNTICRHNKAGTSDYTDTITAFAVIMNLTNKSMHVMEGQPCKPVEELCFRL